MDSAQHQKVWERIALSRGMRTLGQELSSLRRITQYERITTEVSGVTYQEYDYFNLVKIP